MNVAWIAQVVKVIQHCQAKQNWFKSRRSTQISSKHSSASLAFTGPWEATETFHIPMMFSSIEHVCKSKERQHSAHPLPPPIPVAWASPFPPNGHTATKVPCAAQVWVMHRPRRRRPNQSPVGNIPPRTYSLGMVWNSCKSSALFLLPFGCFSSFCVVVIVHIPCGPSQACQDAKIRLCEWDWNIQNLVPLTLSSIQNQSKFQKQNSPEWQLLGRVSLFDWFAGNWRGVCSCVATHSSGAASLVAGNGASANDLSVYEEAQSWLVSRFQPPREALLQPAKRISERSWEVCNAPVSFAQIFQELCRLESLDQSI